MISWRILNSEPMSLPFFPTKLGVPGSWMRYKDVGDGAVGNLFTGYQAVSNYSSEDVAGFQLEV